MLFRTTLLSAVALLLGINQAAGAALEPRSAEIATTACLCHPNLRQAPILKFFSSSLRVQLPQQLFA